MALYDLLQEIVQRHEGLRTTVAVIDTEPVQVIGNAVRAWEIIDLRELPIEERERECRRQIQAEARRPFHLEKGPLFRVTLLQLRAEEHVLLLTMHHIVSDGWSMGILLRELTALYRAYTANKPSPLSELPLQYADYALWQRNWLQREVLERQIAYWKAQLTGAPALLEL